MDKKFLDSKIGPGEVKYIYEIIRWYGYTIEDVKMILGKNYLQMFEILRNQKKKISPEYFYGKRSGESRAKKLWYVLNPVLRQNRIRINSFMDFGGTNCHTAYRMGNYLQLSQNNVYCVDLDEWSGMKWKRKKGVKFIPTSELSTIPDNSINCIHASHTLHHASDVEIKEYIANFYRIIPPGGIFVLYEHDCPSKYFGNLLDITHVLFDVVLTQITTFEEFNKNWISNYKSKKQWDNLFKGKFRQLKVLKKPSVNNNYYCIYRSLKKRVGRIHRKT